MEAALCLAMPHDGFEPSGGVLTPASALGTRLVERLNDSGMELSVRALSTIADQFSLV